MGFPDSAKDFSVRNQFTLCSVFFGVRLGCFALFSFVLFGDRAPCSPGCPVTRCVDQADLEGIEIGVRLSTGSALSLGFGFWVFSPFVLKELALPWSCTEGVNAESAAVSVGSAPFLTQLCGGLS